MQAEICEHPRIASNYASECRSRAMFIQQARRHAEEYQGVLGISEDGLAGLEECYMDDPFHEETIAGKRFALYIDHMPKVTTGLICQGEWLVCIAARCVNDSSLNRTGKWRRLKGSCYIDPEWHARLVEALSIGLSEVTTQLEMLF